jgi:PD-(D/E)XK nuclease superfamily
VLESQIVNGKPYYVLSMSALQAFKRCRKSFDLSYVRGFDAKALPQPITDGASIHQHLAAMSLGTYDVLGKVQQGDEMAAIAWAYGQARPVPSGARVVAVEQPFYHVLIEPDPFMNGYPGVIVRCTFDLAYLLTEPRPDVQNYTVLRDYKSFDRAPTLHVDLDFQGRLYTALGMRIFKSPHVFFEYVYIRRTLPNVPKDKSGGKWSEDECYVNVQLMLSVQEADELWAETQDVARDLVRCMDEGRFYRTDLKTGPHSCSSCLVRHGCVAEVQHTLTQDTIEMFYNIREPIALPPDAKIA